MQPEPRISHLHPGLSVSVRYRDGSFYPATVLRVEKTKDGEEWVIVRWPPNSESFDAPTYRAHIDDVQQSWMATPMSPRSSY